MPRSTEAMTATNSQEAREASLSLNPFKRLRQIGELATSLGLPQPSGWSPVPFYLTRKNVVARAEFKELIEDQLGFKPTDTSYIIDREDT